MPEMRLSEHHFLAAGWRDPLELARVADAFNLRHSDFRDRLCGVAVGYLRDCATRGAQPTLTGAVAVLASWGVPEAIDELYPLLQDTALQPDDTIVNLADDVLRSSQERSENELRSLCRDAIRAINRGLRIDAEHRHGQRPSVPRKGTTRIARRRAAYV